LFGVGYGLADGVANTVQSLTGDVYTQIEPGYQAPAGTVIYVQPAPGIFEVMDPAAAGAKEPWFMAAPTT
jgi:hypothetical protein